MRLSDDFDEKERGFTPTIITALVGASLFILVVLIVVLVANRSTSSSQTQTAATNVQTASAGSDGSGGSYPDTDDLVTGSTLSPSDLDFWDLYPEATATPAPSTNPEATASTAENDPATDGKHTLVTTRKGEEEWVLISPYLPKHEYDFTNLVSQNDLMKYYVDSKQVSYVGVDLSKYQEYVDFVKVKKAGIDFVMIRLGARGYGTGQITLDDYYADNLKRATDAGLEVGVYFYSQAITEAEAVEEANFVLTQLEGYTLQYPVAFDMEFVDNDTARIENLSKAEKTAIAKAFLDTIEAAGHNAILYGDKEWLLQEIDLSKLTAYDVWLSQEADVPDYPYRFTMWQYSTKGDIDGIAGYANLNISFIDYSEK